MAVAEPVPAGAEFPRQGSGREAGGTCRVPIAGWKSSRLRSSHCAQVKTTNPQTGIVGVYSFIFYFKVVFIFVSVHKKVGKRSRDVNNLSPCFVQHLSLGKLFLMAFVSFEWSSGLYASSGNTKAGYTGSMKHHQWTPKRRQSFPELRPNWWSLIKCYLHT